MKADYLNPSLPIEKRVADLLGKMTLPEKIGQLTQVSTKQGDPLSVNEAIRRGRIGSRILASNWNAGGTKQEFSRGDLHEGQRIAIEESRLGIPLIHGRDVIHGFRTVFPVPLAQAASWDPVAVERAASVAAAEARRHFIHWTFAPMVDICRDARWGRIVEGFGEDPWLCSVFASASVRGYQGRDLSEPDRILACAKHFIGYGAAEGGRDYNTVEISDNTLRNLYLPPFAAAIAQGVGTIMCSFNDLNGRPCSANSYLLTTVLREELGFLGFVVSDWESIPETIAHGTAADKRDAARQSLAAGVDMEMIPNCYSNHLEDLLFDGELSEALIDVSVKRILEAKFRLGLFENPYAETAETNEVEIPGESRRCCRRLAARGMVLLKNAGDVLPLPMSADGLALVGPYVNCRRELLGCWTLDGRVEETVSVLEGIRAMVPDIAFSAETAPCDATLSFIRSRETVIIVVGENHLRTGEDACVADPVLPPGQFEFIEAVHRLGKEIILVVCAARPLILTDVEPLVSAILWAWHPGSEGGNAVADILFGHENPSGKLPVTFPRHVGQIPIYYNHKRTGRPVDDYFGAGSRYHDLPGSPLYRFGYGLSYTSFRYSGLEIDLSDLPAKKEVRISVMLANDGSRDGEEVAQCYICDPVSETTRPVRELKDFQRVPLKAGQSKRIFFTLTEKQMAFYGTKGGLILEPGRFHVWVGGDSGCSLAGEFVVADWSSHC